MTTAQLTVTDTGIGLDAQHLPHVFERFYRADKARSRKEGGTGLGLSIAQYVAHSHGGTLQAFSEGTNQGSSFVLRLPLVAATQAPSPASTESPRRSAAEALAASLVHGGRR